MGRFLVPGIRDVEGVGIAVTVAALWLFAALPSLGAEPGPTAAASGGNVAGAASHASPSATAPAPPGARVAVATESESATREALAVLHGGGTAVDAAVTAALVAGVASPSSSGVGGGGFAVVWDAKTRTATTLDFRESAPKTIDTAAFERRPLPTAERGKLVGVPGEVAGLSELHRRFGKLPWAALVERAARVATEGFAASPHLASVASQQGVKLAVDPLLADLYRPGGFVVGAGVRIRNPRLAATLRKIGAGGPRAFYDGPLSADVVAGAKSAAGAVTARDLLDYKPVERPPLHIAWEGYDFFTMGPPSAGGLMLAETLGMLRKEELRRLGPDTGAYTHLLAEVLRGALADRMRFLGDPDHEPVDLARLLATERLTKRRRSIALDRTHAAPRFAQEEHGTHHLVTVDAAGNVVSLTTTVNRAFGAVLTAPASGIVLNDELDDFTSQKAVRPFGLTESPNRARPGARPVSSMTPTLVVRNGVVVAAAGGSGGLTIAPNVVQALLGHLVFGLPPDKAVGAPRFTVPTEGAYISLDPRSPASLRDDLERRGEVVAIQKTTQQAVQLIVRDGSTLRAAADPRKSGAAAAE